MENKMTDHEKPTGWTPVAEPISLDKLGRTPPPHDGWVYDRSELVRAWVQWDPEAGGWRGFFETLTGKDEYVTRLDDALPTPWAVLGQLARYSFTNAR